YGLSSSINREARINKLLPREQAVGFQVGQAPHQVVEDLSLIFVVSAVDAAIVDHDYSKCSFQSPHFIFQSLLREIWSTIISSDNSLVKNKIGAIQVYLQVWYLLADPVGNIMHVILFPCDDWYD
ncbi:hypothetical protein ACJX0J_032017, partial [Zea mays]